MDKILLIPEEKITSFNTHIRKMARLSKKIGMKPIVATTIKTYIEETKVFTDSQKFYIMPIKFYEVKVSGELPKIPDWEFLGLIEHKNTMNMIKGLKEGYVVAEKYYYSKADCEHCNTNRRRKNTVLIVHTPTGEVKQIGKSCLKDYLGHNALEVFQAIGHIAEFDGFESTTGLTNGYRDYFNVNTLVAMTIEHVKTNEYISRSRAFDSGVESTSDILVEKYLKSNMEVTPEAKVEATKVLDYIKAIPVGCNNYINALVCLAKEGYCDTKDTGFITSMIPFYSREIDKLKAKEAKTAETKHVGTLKQRLTLKLEYKYSRNWETAYGLTFLHRFLTPEGDVIVWTTAKSNTELVFNIDSVYSITGTVKNHNDYKGECQTYITRCKINS